MALIDVNINYEDVLDCVITADGYMAVVNFCGSEYAYFEGEKNI